VKRPTGLVVLACGVALVAAPPAMADSLVFIRDNNVWLSNPDGSGQYQVTLDGTAASPYESPSQSDGGTVMAVRQPPGGRRQLVRMTQSGALLNAPVNTPAPGTGAIDARISPNGGLVAYWFVTTVSDPYCAYCVNVAERALFSYPDRFTNYDEIGTPNTGGWPSWVTNDTITVNTGSATQWYYQLGMSEANDWFTDSDLTGRIKTLLDTEVAPTGDRLAVVEGDNQEFIILAKVNGLPSGPTDPQPKPTIAAAPCQGLAGPTGKFVNPTWSSNGRLLAWQEDDGIWTVGVPADLSTCTGFDTAPARRIDGGREPDLSPAAINPGARPGCGNPGNPVACNPNCPTCGPGPGTDLKKKLAAFLAAEAKKLRKLGVHGLRHKKRTVLTYAADQAGKFAVRFTGTPIVRASRASLLASGKHTFAAAGSAHVTMKLTRKGARALRRAKGVRGSLKATFTPAGGAPTSASKTVRLRR
jgi:hypothetical protein